MITRSIAERAQALPGWIRVIDDYPHRNEVVAVLHFGGSDQQIEDTATVDEWGICPLAKNGGHGKRSTVTHWRRIANDDRPTSAC